MPSVFRKDSVPGPGPRPKEGARHGEMILGITFYAIVVVIVVTSLILGPNPKNPWEVVGMLVSAALFTLFPHFIERIVMDPKVSETDPWGSVHQAPLRVKLFFLLVCVPIGIAFTYFATRVTRGGILPIIPLFVLAGYSSMIFSRLGSMVCSVGLLLTLQGVMWLVHRYMFGLTEFLSMLVGLAVFNAFFLIARSAEAARNQAEILSAELEASNAKLRDYALRVEDLAVADERNRLAREIHDSIGHALTVVNVQVEAARTVFESDPEKAKSALEAAQAYTRQGLNEVREAVSSLRQSPLENRSLQEVIEDLLVRARTSGLDAELEILGDPRGVPAPLEHTLLRVAQESLTNTLRHAQAKHYQIQLDYRFQDEIFLQARDDGRGASVDGDLNGYGLLGLKERVGHHEGETWIETEPGAGFSLKVRLPLQ